MKIAFHSNQLSMRGTEIALYDYAYYSRELLGHESIIISDANTDLSALEKFKAQFEVYLYNDFKEAYNLVKERGVDAIYYQKSGQYDGKVIPGIKNLVHAVFQFNEPHGDVYSYISHWLEEKMTGKRGIAVPCIVDILRYDHTESYRSYLGIPEDAIVFGYYGGPTSFNIDFAKKAVVDVARLHKSIYFLFMNSQAFCNEPNVIFLEGTADMEKKVGFINTCDACIHARNGGESFGLAVAEFSSKNKPILTTTYCTEPLCDLAHIEMLGDKALLYHDYNSLYDILTNLDKYLVHKDWNMYREYAPEKVMKHFNKIFLT